MRLSAWTPQLSSRFVSASVLIVCAAYPLLYAGMYAGDAEIHLVYGENAAKGAFFEFNSGEASSGVTSPGWMLVLAGLFLVLPAEFVPPAVKLLCLATWYALIYVVYKISARIMHDNGLACGIAIICGVLPGSAYNSTIGMENGLFALLIYTAFYLMLIWAWFDTSRHVTWRDLLVGGLLGVSTWLRPEGIVVGGLLVLYRSVLWWRTEGFRRAIMSQVLCTAGFTFFVLTLVYFHYIFTGDLVPSSGRSRTILGHLDSLRLGPLLVSTRFAERLIAYLPLTALFVVGLVCIARKVVPWRDDSRSEGSEDTITHICTIMCLMFALFFVLYSTLLGTAHLARYIIFLMPIVVIVGFIGVAGLWRSCSAGSIRTNRPLLAILGGMGLLLVVTFGVETVLRMNLTSHQELWRVMQAPSLRRQSSDELARDLGIPTADGPSESQVVLGCVEVQRRYWLDERFVIRSLDGRVDPLFFQYCHKGKVDYLGYLRARHIDYLIDLPKPRTIRELGRPFMDLLAHMAPGDRRAADGVDIFRMPSGAFKVIPEHGSSIP